MAWPKPVPAPVMNQTGVEDIVLFLRVFFRMRFLIVIIRLRVRVSKVFMEEI